MGRAEFEIREDLWPVLYVRVRGRVTEPEWREMFEAYGRFYRRGQRFCAITDASGLRWVPDAQARSVIAELTKKHEPESMRWVLNSHVVVDSTLVRGALTALSWLAPPVYPIAYVATLREALARAVGALERAGGQVPEPLRVFVASQV